LRPHIALTGITPERPAFTPLDILPIKLACDVARRATGTDKTVIELSGKAESRDGPTGQVHFAQVTTKKNAHLLAAQNLTREGVRDAPTAWANQVGARLNGARADQR